MAIDACPLGRNLESRLRSAVIDPEIKPIGHIDGFAIYDGSQGLFAGTPKERVFEEDSQSVRSKPYPVEVVSLLGDAGDSRRRRPRTL